MRLPNNLPHLIFSLALLAPLILPTPASAGPSFEALKGRAEPQQGLGNFLKRYVGACSGNEFELRDCAKNLRTSRKTKTGKLLYVRLPDRHARLLRVLRSLPGRRLKLGLTPFFDAEGYGLSRNRAPRFDRHGNPRARLLPFSIQLPLSVSQRSFELLMRSGNLQMELIFVPRKAWRVKRKGQEAAEGVAASFKGLRLSSARSGETLGELSW